MEAMQTVYAKKGSRSQHISIDTWGKPSQKVHEYHEKKVCIHLRGCGAWCGVLYMLYTPYYNLHAPYAGLWGLMWGSVHAIHTTLKPACTICRVVRPDVGVYMPYTPCTLCTGLYIFFIPLYLLMDGLQNLTYWELDRSIDMPELD